MGNIIQLLIGLTMITLALRYIIYHKFIFMKHAVTIRGRIIEYRQGNMTKNGIHYYPVIAYLDPINKKKTTVEIKIGSHHALNLGAELELLYYKKPNGISDVRIKKDSNLYVIPIVFILFGIMSIITAITNL